MTQTTIDTGTDATGPGAGERARPAVRPAAAPLPRVNLLPAEIREVTRLRAIQAGLAGGVLAATALVGLVALAASAETESARDELTSARTAAAQVAGQVDELSHVRGVYAEVEAAQAAVDTARAAEVPWSRLLNDLSLTIPEGVWIETVTVSPGTAATGSAAASHGSITYTGRGRSHDDVATWLEALSGQPGLTDATFTTSAQDDTDAVPTVTFSSTANVTEEALASGTEG